MNRPYTAYISFHIQVKVKNRTDFDVFEELPLMSEKEENEGKNGESELIDESHTKDDTDEGEHEVLIMEETEPLMIEKKCGFNNKRKLTDEEPNLFQENSVKRILSKQAMDEEREALIGEELSTQRDLDCQTWIPVNNSDIFPQARDIPRHSASVVDLTGTAATSKREEDGDGDFSAKDLLCFAWQVAQGMVSIKRMRMRTMTQLY